MTNELNKKVRELILSLANPETCLQASWELAKIGPQAVDSVIDALLREGYKDNRVGIFSCIVLGNIKDPRAVGPLIDTLKRNPSWEVRRRAAWALGEIKDKCAVDPLIDALTGDTNPDVRAFSAAALGKIGDRKALRPLIQALGDLEQTNDYSPVCYSVIPALGCIGGREAIDALLKILRSGIPTSLIDPVTTLFTAFRELDTSFTYNDVARTLAAHELGKIGDKSILNVLRNVVEHERSEIVKKAVEQAIQRIEER